MTDLLILSSESLDQALAELRFGDLLVLRRVGVNLSSRDVAVCHVIDMGKRQIKAIPRLGDRSAVGTDDDDCLSAINDPVESDLKVFIVRQGGLEDVFDHFVGAVVGPTVAIEDDTDLL